MIAVISDVHLGYEKCNRESFIDFVNVFLGEEHIDHVVLLGDILDFWRRSARNVVKENRDILSALHDLDAQIHYVVGNHDYSLYNNDMGLPFQFTKDLVLQSGHRTFRFIHGYQIETYPLIHFYEGISSVLCTSGDGTGQVLSDVWEFYQKKIKSIISKEAVYEPRLENLTREELDYIVESILKYPEEKTMYGSFTQEEITDYEEATGIKNEVLVYGHTHNPHVFLHEANPGSWVSDSRIPNTFLTIDEGEVTMNYWPDYGCPVNSGTSEVVSCV
jgi:UDP-2,3-diacylglucosamine pyrophosphatase LpxH